MQLTPRIFWIIIDLIKCNPIISSCVQINTLLFHLPLKALTWFQTVPLNRRSRAGSRCGVYAASGVTVCQVRVYTRLPALCRLTWNAVTLQRAVSLRRTFDWGQETQGEALEAAGSQDQVVTEGESRSLDCHLDVLFSLYGRSPWVTCFDCGILLGARPGAAPLGLQTH